MKLRKRKFQDISPIAFLLLRDELGLRRYQKQVPRSKEEREILIDLAIKKIAEKEKDDFIPEGFRKRRVKIL
jgi:hypothetical protein